LKITGSTCPLPHVCHKSGEKVVKKWKESDKKACVYDVKMKNNSKKQIICTKFKINMNDVKALPNYVRFYIQIEGAL
jgi:hypothetical protein